MSSPLRIFLSEILDQYKSIKAYSTIKQTQIPSKFEPSCKTEEGWDWSQLRRDFGPPRINSRGHLGSTYQKKIMEKLVIAVAELTM